MSDTIPADLKDILIEAVKEEIELGGDAGSIVACMRDALADNSYTITPAAEAATATSNGESAAAAVDQTPRPHDCNTPYGPRCWCEKA